MEDIDNYNDYGEMIDNYIDDENKFIAREPERKKDLKRREIRFTVALDPVQIKELMQKAYAKSKKHGMIVEFQVKTGVRIGELVNMLVENIEFNSCFVKVTYVKEKDELEEWTAKTVSSYRNINLNKKLAMKLKNYLQESNITNGYVFRSRENGNKSKRYNTRSLINMINELARSCDSIGRTIGSHALRRTFASFLLKNHVAITEIQRLLGHVKLKTTLDYLKNIRDPEFDTMFQEAVDKIGK